MTPVLSFPLVLRDKKEQSKERRASLPVIEPITSKGEKKKLKKHSKTKSNKPKVEKSSKSSKSHKKTKSLATKPHKQGKSTTSGKTKQQQRSYTTTDAVKEFVSKQRAEDSKTQIQKRYFGEDATQRKSYHESESIFFTFLRRNNYIF